MTARGHELSSSADALSRAYDAALLDLDGVVYRGTQAVAHAAQALRAAEAEGMRLTFVTNNASRTPEEVAAVLRGAGVDADPAEVATSAQAAARLLADRLEPGAAVLVVGTNGLRQAVKEAGLTPVDSAEAAPAAVVQGFSDRTTYAMLAEAAVAIGAGALWVATNLDSTIPSARGLLPGNGALVAALSLATGQTPLAAGKPQRPLHDEAVRRTGATRPLVVGDRLDTDIDGAIAVGADSLLVLTGVSSLLDVVRLPAGRRPSYVGEDLRALLEPHPLVEIDADSATCGPATAVLEAGVITVQAGGSATAAIRATCALGWAATDRDIAISAIGGAHSDGPVGAPAHGKQVMDRSGAGAT
ncbi:MAG: HAD-IIA family hydrolase [Actinomycetota bacterium]